MASALFNIICSDFCPRRVVLPLNAYVDDPRVVKLNNTLKFISWGFAIFWYALIFKGYTKSAYVELQYNAWMDDFDVPIKTAPYCNNNTYNYAYSTNWIYTNITCKSYPTNKIFTKPITSGTYWISTMFQDEVSHICRDNDERETCQTSSNNDLIPQPRTTSFVLGVESYFMTITIRATVGKANYDSAVDENIPLSFLLPNGKEVKVPDHARANGQGVLLKMTVQEWLSFFQVESGLDGYAGLNADPTSTGYGTPLHRITGIGLAVKIKLTNQPSNTFDITSNRIRAVLELHPSFDWKRTTIPPQPTQYTGEQVTTDNYGIHFTLSPLPSEVKLFDLQSCVGSLFDIAVFFTIMNVVVRVFALSFLGSVSSKWRQALTQHVDKQILLNRNSNDQLRRIQSCEHQAKVLLARLGKASIQELNNTDANETKENKIADASKDTSKEDPQDYCSVGDLNVNNPASENSKSAVFAVENAVIFQQWDANGDGDVDMDELAMVLDKFDFQYDDDVLQAMMSILDRDGNGTFELEEFEKTVQRAMENISDEELIAEEEKDELRRRAQKEKGDVEKTNEKDDGEEGEEEVGEKNPNSSSSHDVEAVGAEAGAIVTPLNVNVIPC